MAAADRGDVARFSLDVPRPVERSELMVGAGLRRSLSDLLLRHAPAHRYAVLSDEVVATLHGKSLVADLNTDGLSAEIFTFVGGEAGKTATAWAELVEALASAGFGRDCCVVAVGGGVTGDMAGFVASTFARGVPLVQVPTSLLAMIDASIGGKTGIDLAAGKNLAGTFHQPRLVVADPELLHTLPDPELRNGLAEAVKHGAIADASYLQRIGEGSAAILARQPHALQRLIADSVRIKLRSVAEDAREAGARAALNFGHTIGHAVERASAYTIAHGQGVAIGMVVEARIGETAGLTSAGTADGLAAVLAGMGLPTAVPDGIGAGAVLDATRTDKKARRGEVRYVLLEELGRVARDEDGGWTHAVSDQVVRDSLETGGERPSASASNV